MVKEFLGNIKGERGAKGDDGGFNGESLGSNNLLSLSNLSAYGGNNDTFYYNVETGLITYENASWYLREFLFLKQKVYRFRFFDYTSHSDLYGGKVRLRILQNNEDVYNQDIGKNEVVDVDLTNIDESIETEIRFNFSNSTLVSGFIEKPMLVEADYPVLWNPSNTDRRALDRQQKLYSRYRLYLSDIPNTGDNISFSTFYQEGSSSHGFTLKRGVYLLNWSLLLRGGNDGGSVRLRILNSDEDSTISFYDINDYTQSNMITKVINVENELTLDFDIRNDTPSNKNVSADQRNSIEIVEL